AHQPAEVLFSALYDTRFGIARKDLVEWARELAEPEVKFTHVAVRVEEEAIRNAIEHYKVDEVLISTFAGEQSRWLQSDLIGRVREVTDKPVSHVESG